MSESDAILALMLLSECGASSDDETEEEEQQQEPSKETRAQRKRRVWAEVPPPLECETQHKRMYSRTGAGSAVRNVGLWEEKHREQQRADKFWK